MKSSEKRLLAQLLRVASERYSHNGCSALDQEMSECLTKEEWVELDKNMQIWNGTPDDHDPESLVLAQTDWALMYYFSNLLAKESKEE